MIRIILIALTLINFGCSNHHPYVNNAESGPVNFSIDADLESLLTIPESTNFHYNMNVAERDRLLCLPKDADSSGDITRFNELDAATLEKLILGRWADPRDRQNEAPSIAKIFRFMKRWPEVRAYGYAVSSKREDYRISIEGIFVKTSIIQKELRREFLEFAKDADELTTDQGLTAWWD